MLIYVLKFRQESTHWLQTVGDTFNDVVELINDEDLSDVRKQDIRLAMLNTKKEMLSIYCYLNIFKYNHIVLLYTHLYLIMLCGSLHFWRLPNFDFNNRSEIDYAKVIVKIIYSMIVKASGNGFKNLCGHMQKLMGKSSSIK